MVIVWKVRVQHLSVYFFSFFTVAGIALFASWSILSNITATLILFFHHPLRIGNTIKIIDGDNTIEGQVKDLTLFSIVLIDEESREITYPNNLALQKPILILKAERAKKRKKASELQDEQQL